MSFVNVISCGLSAGLLKAVRHVNCALAPHAGTPAITSRGMKEADVEQVADVLDSVLKLLVRLRDELGKKQAGAGKKDPAAYVLGGKEFRAFLEPTPAAADTDAPADRAAYKKEIEGIKRRVAEFVAKFPAPGLDEL